MARPDVLVGVDGSEPSSRAAVWAATEAALRGVGLTVCSVANDDVLAEPSWSATLELMWEHAEDAAARGAEQARRAEPRVPVSTRVLVGAAPDELVRASAEYGLLVLGSRGLGAFRGLLLGSVGERVAQHAGCPVVVVRGDGTGWDRPVLLGVDGAAGGAAAAEYAFAAADRRGVPLVALSATRRAAPAPAGVHADAPTRSGGPETVRRGQEDALAGWTRRYPQVRVEHRVVRGTAAAALIDASAACGLVVVGSRGHGGLAGDLLGSVSTHVLRHAACPVAIVRTRSGSAG